MSLVLRSGMLPATLGIGAGLVAALGLSRVLRSLLFGVGRDRSRDLRCNGSGCWDWRR